MIAAFSIEPAWVGWLIFIAAPVGYVLLFAGYFTLDKRYELKSEAVQKSEQLASAVTNMSKLQKATDTKLDEEIKDIVKMLERQEGGLRNSVDKLTDNMNAGFLKFATDIGMMKGQLGILVQQKDAAKK